MEIAVIIGVLMLLASGVCVFMAAGASPEPPEPSVDWYREGLRREEERRRRLDSWNHRVEPGRGVYEGWWEITCSHKVLPISYKNNNTSVMGGKEWTKNYAETLLGSYRYAQEHNFPTDVYDLAGVWENKTSPTR